MTTNDALRRLQDAAREYAKLVHGEASPRRVIILDEHRERIAEVRIPACAGESLPAVGPVPTLPPTAAQQGWDFSEPWPRLDGTLLKISGKPLELLKVLAAAKGPMSVDELRRKAWPEYLAEDITIRWTIGKLKALLKAEVPLCEEPITTRPEGGYVLTLR